MGQVITTCEIHGLTKVEPVGACIYCGAKNELSDEHVVPFGLGGNLVLSKSSCQQCAVTTSGFERRVLRGFMLASRTVANLPTRRPKDRPALLKMEVGESDDMNLIQLPVS